MPFAAAAPARRPITRVAWSLTIAVVLGVLAAVFAPMSAAHAAPTTEASTVVQLTNDERAAGGAGPVQHSDALQSVAQAWAEHMAAEGTMEHNPKYSEQIPAGWHAAAENIAMGASDPAEIHAMWVGSPGHHRNMINGEHNVMGFGSAAAADGTVYAVEVFAGYSEFPESLGVDPGTGGETADSPPASPEESEPVAEETAPVEPVAPTTPPTEVAQPTTPPAETDAAETGTTSPVTPTTSSAPPVADDKDSSLASTGSDNFTMLAVGVSAVLLAGAVLLVVLQRRRRA